MVNIGDKVVITKMSGKVLDSPHVATVEDVGNTWFDIEEAINGEDVVLKASPVDDWCLVEDYEKEVSNIPEVGDEIIVTRVNRVKLTSPRKVTVVDVALPIIEVYPDINGETLLFSGGPSMDAWHIVEEDKEVKVSRPVTTPKEGQLVKVVCDGFSDYGEVVETDVSDAGEYEFKIKSGESSTTYKMNEVDSVETYKGDEDKIMPNYLQLASQGMTFSEFAGEDITEESLNFRPYDDKVNHPNHYNKYSREVIESIKGLCTPDEFRGYLKGNIIKYSARYSDKDGIQDIDKLAKYTQFLKEFELEMAELSEEE